MIEPLPNCFSICAKAEANALLFSSDIFKLRLGKHFFAKQHQLAAYIKEDVYAIKAKYIKIADKQVREKEEYKLSDHSR